MKYKVLTILFATLLCVTIPFKSNAQIGEVRAGAGLVFGEEDLGIQVGGTYRFNPSFRFGADLLYWFVDDVQRFGVNANLNYVFHHRRDLLLYGLGTVGLHVLDADQNNSELAFGVGAGLEYDLRGPVLFSELNFYINGFDQTILAVGLRYRL